MAATYTNKYFHSHAHLSIDIDVNYMPQSSLDMDKILFTYWELNIQQWLLCKLALDIVNIVTFKKYTHVK